MHNLYPDPAGPYLVMVGARIRETVLEAIEISERNHGIQVSFSFNNIRIRVKSDSDVDLIVRDFFRMQRRSRPRQVGPYPQAELSPEELAFDREMEEKREALIEAARIKDQQRLLIKRQRVERLLAKSPGFELVHPNRWQTYQQSMEGVAGFAERWARLMQLRINQGQPLENIAEKSANDADLEGLTGYTYGIAVTILARCWKYGEELRRWHNLSVQIGTEGEEANLTNEVLNPGLMKIIAQ